jgi:DNA phosphorothioation-dependent restriction protein DptG
VVKLKSSLDRGLLLTRKLLNKGFLVVKLKSSLDLVSSNHQSSDDFNLTTMNPLFSSCLVSSNPVSSDDQVNHYEPFVGSY